MAKRKKRIKGKLIKTVKVKGLRIRFREQLSKTRTGKDRLIVSIRQAPPKEWRVASSLSFVYASNIRFEKPASQRTERPPRRAKAVASPRPTSTADGRS